MSAHAIYSLVGYVGSALIVASLTMRSILRLRVLGLAGAAVFTLYGVLIGAYPIVVTNGVIVLIHLHFLREILTAEEYFKVLAVRGDSRYLEYFLRFYAQEIELILSGFSYRPAERQLTLFILRDLVPAGLFIAEIRDGECLRVHLDFVIPRYRDFKIGRFLYADGSGVLACRGYRRVESGGGSRIHTDYLERMGFVREPDSERAGGTIYRLMLTPPDSAASSSSPT